MRKTGASVKNLERESCYLPFPIRQEVNSELGD